MLSIEMYRRLEQASGQLYSCVLHFTQNTYLQQVTQSSSQIIAIFPCLQKVLTRKPSYFSQTHQHLPSLWSLSCLRTVRCRALLLNLIPMVIIASSIYPPSVTVKWATPTFFYVSVRQISMPVLFNVNKSETFKKWDKWADLLSMAKTGFPYTPLLMTD